MCPATYGQSAILYRNDSNTTFLIDIPKSIELAQCFNSHTNHKRLLSSSPRLEPFPSIEPKTADGRARVASHMSPEFLSLHEERARIISEALSDVKSNLGFGSWCLQRSLEASVRSKEPELYLHDNRAITQVSMPMPPMVLSTSLNLFPSVASIQNCLLLNTFPTSTTLQAPSDETYHVPPQSAFILGSVDTSTSAMSSAADLFLKSSDAKDGGLFDMVLLDPPWANRSVKRSQSYITTYTLKKLTSFLSQHVKETGIISIWITNKETVESEAYSMMADCGFELFEEWLWIKSTVSGEPVSDLNGVWRRPYEVLLLFRRSPQKQKSPDNLTLMASMGVQRRVLAAVPDLHSRKPCLKELFVTLLLPSGTCRVLEIFARHLTAGWWSWGNEVLKFNWQGHWTQQDPEDN